VYAVSCAGGRGCYSLFAIVHQRSVSIWVCSFNKAAAIPASLALFMHSSSNRLRPSRFVCNTTSVKAHSFRLRALSSSNFLLYMMITD